jgi:hypothetical protein
VVAWQVGVVERVPNLLVAPNDFANGAWNPYGGASITVIPDAAPGPFEGTRAQRITAHAGAAGLVFLQGMGQSEPGVPYVASVYLRADEPQTIGLSSHLASARCEVGLEWERCVTPVGFRERSLDPPASLLDGLLEALRRLRLRCAVRAG